jgi:AraC-like DNA-binding protein
MVHPPPRQTVAPGCLPRHRHAEGYMAVVLNGAYEEAGDAGRRRVAAGDVVVHQAWEAHLNRTPGAGAQVLNLPLPAVPLQGFGRVGDLDALARLAARDPVEAAAALAEAFEPVAAPPIDWPDLLAAALVRNDVARLGDWAASVGLSAEHVSRGFARVFGVSPQRYRLEARVRAALADLAGQASLAVVAAQNGFADQAHMTRSVRAVTGLPPGAWRRSNPFKT